MANLNKSLKLNCIGIMNGTSIDGADFVLTSVNSKTLNSEFKAHQKFSFSKSLKNDLLSCAQHKMKVDELALLHHRLGRYYADCFHNLSSEFNSAQIIGLHGQTVFHKGAVATLQIGEPSYLSAASGLPVISDFRAADIALGGHGAPIATFFHEKNFGQKNSIVAVHNLGGISNLSLIKNGNLVSGFDTGPANMLLDLTIQKHTKQKKLFDNNGKWASMGEVNKTMLQKMLRHPYFKKPAPKSCGREEFGENFYRTYAPELKKMRIHDQLATLTELVAVSIAHAYRRSVDNTLPEKIIFCGGGAQNLFLLERIQFLLEETNVQTTEAYGWPTDSIEGGAFALLAAAKYLNLNSNLPHSTGARRATSLGKITFV